jgi:hypothetical protein
MKYHPLFDMAIASILKSDPSAVVVFLLNEANALWNLKLKSRLLKHFENDKTQITSRVLYVPQMKSNVYQKVLCCADINLDPFPFGKHRILIFTVHFVFSHTNVYTRYLFYFILFFTNIINYSTFTLCMLTLKYFFKGVVLL